MKDTKNKLSKEGALSAAKAAYDSIQEARNVSKAPPFPVVIWIEGYRFCEADLQEEAPTFDE